MITGYERSLAISNAFFHLACLLIIAGRNQKKITPARGVAQTTPHMSKSFPDVLGSIVAPKGFHAAGVFCDIKRLGTGKGSNKGRKRDLALIVSEVPAPVARA